MEADSELYFSKEQLKTLIPLLERSRRWYKLARMIQSNLFSFLNERQARYMLKYTKLGKSERRELEGCLKWSPPSRCYPGDYYLWRAEKYLRMKLKPEAMVARDRWYWKTQRQMEGLPTPDFYGALVFMDRLRSDLALTAKQSWQLHWVTQDLMVALRDYQSLLNVYRPVLIPAQRNFVEKHLSMLSHVFPP